MNEFWQSELDRQNREYEEQQRVLEERQNAQQMAQQQAALQAQRDFEEQQRQLMEQQKREQEALMQQQMQYQTQGRLAELEQENFRARSQYEQDQLMLQQYDQRESYGIYKFITSMLRAMHSTTGDDEALEPLRSRYEAQHYRLTKFYYECSNLRYLTSLITIPKLPQDAPNLRAEDDEAP
ncbi:hypothetical protein BN1723_016074, partial [Verticillium longisporum]